MTKEPELLPETIEWEDCCDHPGCKRKYPSNMGTFYEGSGFDPEEAAELDKRWNAYPKLLARIEALTSALHQYRSDMLYPPLADSRERRIAMIDALINRPSQ